MFICTKVNFVRFLHWKRSVKRVHHAWWARKKFRCKIRSYLNERNHRTDIDIRNVITSNSVWRTRDTYEIRARIARICIGSRRYFIAVRARYLVMRNVSSWWVPGSVSPLPLERGNLPISTTASAFSALRRAATISSSSVRRRNNLIPYSRGGCRPWRIEWNKIKPRIPRVLWRGSVPYPSRKSRISTSAACARVYIHTVSFCSSFCFTFHSLISLFSLFCALHLCPPHGFLFVTALLPMIAWCLAVFQDTVLLRINDVFMLTGLGEIIN